MKKIITALTVATSIIAASSVVAQEAKSLKQAERATENRQAVFGLLGSNMGPLGGMAKGKMPFDVKVVEKNALRINQLSHMIADYSRTNTSNFKVKTGALKDIWEKPEAYEKRTQALIDASSNLMMVAKSGDEGAIKKLLVK